MGQREIWDDFYRSNSRAWRGMTKIENLPFPKGSRILEIGCGNGKTLAALIEDGFEAVGIDFSEVAVESCRKLLGHEANVQCASVTDLPFEDGSFDGALMFHVMENLSPEECQTAKNEIKRVLAEGGLLMVRSFALGDLRSEKGEKISEDTVVRGNGIKYRYFTEESMLKAFEGTECVSIRTVSESTRFGGTRSRIEAVFRF